MHVSPLSSCRLLLAAVLVCGAGAFAQQSAAPASPSPASEKPLANDAVVLSPFEVSTDKDNGFAAASSLAGGRLALDLRDTPAAYSVITREFIDALGITDLQSAAEWTTGGTLNVDNGQ